MTRDELLAAARAAVTETAPDRAAQVAPLLDLPPTGSFSADHATLAEATLVVAIETVIKNALGEQAPPVLERFAHKRAEARAYAAFLPRAGGSFQRVDGESQQRLDDTCPACQKAGNVIYTGTEVLAGDLEWVHVMHCEVKDGFTCKGCNYTWTEFRFI